METEFNSAPDAKDTGTVWRLKSVNPLSIVNPYGTATGLF